MGAPLLRLFAAFACGCLLGAGVPASAVGALLGLALAALVLATLAARGAAAALAAAAVAAGAAGAAVERDAYDANPLVRWLEGRTESVDAPVRVEGRALADADLTADPTLLLAVETIEEGGRRRALPGRARLRVGGAAAGRTVLAGDRVSVWATLRRPRSYGTPGAADAEAEARRDGVHALGSCKSPRLLDAAAPPGMGGPQRWLALARSWSRQRLAAHVLPGPEQGLVRAMVLGDRAGVDPATAEAFRVAGTYHVLALSGAQVALLAGLLLAAARRWALSPAAAGAAVCAAVIAYAGLVGAQAPVVRAAAMAVVALCGRALDLDAPAANTLGAAGLLLLAAQPSAVADPALQLSFAAAAGIVLLAEPLRAGLPRLPLRLELAVAVSLAAQLPLLPLLALHFHRIAPAAPLFNLAAVPLATAVLLAGVLVLATAALVPPLAPLAGSLAWIAAHALLRSGPPAALQPALDLRVPDPPWWACAALWAGLALLAPPGGGHRLERSPAAADAAAPGRRRRGAAWTALGIAGLVVGPETPPGDGRLHLTVLDVGQGDCLMLRSPAGRVWMVDAGGALDGRPGIGERVVGPHLWWLGVRRIDGLVITHPHPDHVGGVPFLLQAFRPRRVWEGPAPREAPGYSREAARGEGAGPLEQALRAQTGARHAVARGARALWDGVEIEVLGPQPALRSRWRAGNDDSVVTAFRLGDVTLLLAGDVEAAGERALGRAPAAVLKVPHHGSRTSSTPGFVAGVAPRLAVVSAGFRSPFGHPHPEVLDRYRRAGVLLLRTDLDGAVTVSTDGRRLWVRSFRSGFEARLR